MKLFLVFLFFLITCPSLRAQSIEERLKKIEDRLEEDQLDKSLERFQFSGTFINYGEYLDSHQKNPSDGSKTLDHGLLMSMHLALNIDAKISSNVSFLSTLAMGKVWNNDGRTGMTENSYHSNEGSYAMTGSEAKFDVAYMRWKPEETQWTFALGRMTTQGGPPMNQLDGLYRNGTYPRFSYNAIFDGAAAVYDFSKWLPPTKSFKTRLFYTPYFFLDSEDRTASQTGTDGSGNEGGKVKRRADQIAWLNEWEQTDLSYTKKLSLFSMLWYYDNYYDEGYQTTKPGLEYYRALSHTLYLGLEGLFNTGFNFSWSYLRVNARLSGEDPERSDSSLFNLNYAFKNGFVIGWEHIATDKDFYLDEYTYLRFNDFYQRSNNNGDHVFFTIKLPHQQSLRLGVYRYKAGVAPANLYFTKQQTTNSYLSYRVDF